MRLHRLVTTLVCLATGLGFGLALAQPASANGNCPSYFTGFGTGTPSDPYEVDSALDLAEVSFCLSASFIQTGNIDLASAAWTPLGTTSVAPFTGTYDGGGFSISNLSVATDTTARGLFGYTSQATLTGINLSSGSVTGSAYVGALVGSAVDTAISDSSSAVSVTGWNYVGGLVGLMSVASSPNQTLTTSYTTGTVTGVTNSVPVPPAVASYVGGLVGLANRIDITSSYSSAIVSSTGNYSAGIAGGTNLGSIANTYSRGAVTGDWQVAGLVGEVADTPVSNSYATGLVTAGAPPGPSSKAQGGLIGTSGSNPWTALTWDIQTTGQTAAVENSNPNPPGTMPSTTDQMKTLGTFTGLGWNISTSWTPTTTWVICSTFNGGYPHLAAFYDEFTAPCFTAPTTPAAPTVTAGNGQATVTVNPQMGGPAASWVVTSTPGSLTCPITGTSGSCTISGLTNGTTYTFTSTATNRIGTSAASPASNPVTPQSPGGGTTPTPTPTPTPTASPSPSAVITPVAQPTSAPVLYGQNDRPVAPGVNAVTGPIVSVTVPVRANSPAGAAPADAPRVQASRGQVTRVSVNGLPASSTVTTDLRVGDRWVRLGTSRTGVKGRTTLPAFQTSIAGSYLLRITATDGAKYVRVDVA